MDGGLVQGDGLRLRVVEGGVVGGPTVLLVHGYPDNSSVWDGVAGVLERDFHVVRFDVRGTGGSEAPSGRGGYRLERLAGDIVAVARVVSPDSPVHLVGHDWGSIQCWHAVTDPRHAAVFATFTSISGPCLDHVDDWVRRNVARLRFGRVVRQLTHSWYIGFFQLPVLPEWGMRVLRGRFRAEWRDVVHGIELYRANMLGGRTRAERRTAVPVQQVALTRDSFVTPAILDAAAPFCDALYRRELPLSHWAPRTHPDVIAQAVAEFATGASNRALRRIGDERGDRRRGGNGRRFGGRLVLVTGGGSGIGRASAVAFADAGADVVVVDVDGDTAERTAADVRARGGRAQVYVADVADELTGLAREVAERHGVPDIVLANAGIGMAGGFLATEEADWRRVLDVNLLGVVHTLKAFAPLLVDRGTGGHLVVTASAAAFTPWPALTAYATTKAAVLSLAQSLRTELAPHGIGVSAVCPGVIATNIITTTRFVGQDEATQRASRQRTDTAFRRRGHDPARVAKAVLRAVERNRAVVPVAPEAHLAAVGARLSPTLVRRFGGWFGAGR